MGVVSDSNLRLELDMGFVSENEMGKGDEKFVHKAIMPWSSHLAKREPPGLNCRKEHVNMLQPC